VWAYPTIGVFIESVQSACSATSVCRTLMFYAQILGGFFTTPSLHRIFFGIPKTSPSVISLPDPRDSDPTIAMRLLYIDGKAFEDKHPQISLHEFVGSGSEIPCYAILSHD
jgi:hypothetical protein